MENEKDKSIPPVPYKRFKELVDQNKELKLENTKLRAQIDALGKIILEHGLLNEYHSIVGSHNGQNG